VNNSKAALFYILLIVEEKIIKEKIT